MRQSGVLIDTCVEAGNLVRYLTSKGFVYQFSARPLAISGAISRRIVCVVDICGEFGWRMLGVVMKRLQLMLNAASF